MASNSFGKAILALVLLIFDCHGLHLSNRIIISNDSTLSTPIYGGRIAREVNSTNDAYWAVDPQRQNYVLADHTPKLKDPCDYRMYVDFNNEVEKSRGTKNPYAKAVAKKYTDHPQATATKPKIMSPQNLCIRTDSQKNIDLNQFDCLPDKLDIEQVMGFCGCGSRWSLIDLNDNRSYLGLNLASHSYEYQAFQGLDKFLVIESNGDNAECVASRFGHCTLHKYKKRESWTITKCQKGFKCRNISVWSSAQRSAFHNDYTDEWYGICISEKTPDSLKDPYRSSATDASDVSAILLVTIIVITLNYCIHNSENTNKRRNKSHSKFIC